MTQSADLGAIVLAIAVKLTASDGPRGGGLVAQITANGLFVPLAALTFEVTMFLPLAIAMVSGDSIAGEANQGTLRALLTSVKAYETLTVQAAMTGDRQTALRALASMRQRLRGRTHAP